MKRFLHIFSYVRGYWRYGALNIISNILSVIFSLFSLTMIAPFLNLLFFKQEEEYRSILAKGAPELKVSADAIVDNFNYYLSQIILEKGKMQAWVFICIAVIVIMFLKNLFRYLGLFFMANVRNGVVKDLRNAMHTKIL